MNFSGGHRAIVAALLAALVAAGCAGVKQSAPPPAPAAAAVAPTAPPAPDAAGGSQTAAPAAPAATAPPSQPAAVPPAPDQAAAKPAAKPAAPEAKAPAKPAAAAPPSAKAAPAAPVAKAAAPPLDLKTLETELKETKAIGVMTKLSIKNQVDDLLSQFRAFYQGKLKITLAELRRPFDLLVLKLLSLLQDSDPTLAAAIVASREAIWGILSDRTKFASLDGG
ncbi:MAG TPA: hypothetical protein VGP14_06480 [Casimicrobiaceae bacterium]|jgi:hypothetical protein|nr:hypothetical protein [Casimicrobiaceae bacterium]